MPFIQRILTAAALAFAATFPGVAAASAFEPLGLILTWQQDPTTTMTIDWHTEASEAEALEYRPAGGAEWARATPSSHPFPFTDRTIHRVELTGLEPAGQYEFRTAPEGRVYRFRTMPASIEAPLRIALGGDVRHSQEWMERTNRVALSYDPEFIVWGGDLAYADGREDRLYRWDEFIEAMMNTLIDENGRVVPVVVGLGNHEVRGGYYFRDDNYAPEDAWRESVSPYFYALFAFPGHPGYGVLDFGDYLSLVMLDSAHNNPVEGVQTEWLAGVLEARAGRPHVIPVYHVAAFPTVRDYDGDVQAGIREHWIPLFERHGVRVAFENHDHTYKRTYPIRGGSVRGDGIVYLGDGTWGVGTREHYPVEETWYLKRAASKRHAIIATLQGTHQHFLVVDEDGVVIDEYPERPAPKE